MGCISYLDETISIIANLFAISQHLILLFSEGFDTANLNEKYPFIFDEIQIDYPDYALITFVSVFIGMIFTSKWIWELVGRKEIAPKEMVLGWFPYQLIFSLLTCFSWWVVFRFAVGFKTNIFASLPAFGGLLVIFMLVTGGLGLLLQNLEWSRRLG